MGAVPVPGVEAILQRYRLVAGGYLMAVRVAATVEVTDWHAELVMPEGVQVGAGQGTTIEAGLPFYRAIPAEGHLVPSAGGVAAGAVFIAIGADQRAPLQVRVKADGVEGSGYAPVTGVYVIGQLGRLVRATEQWWPGSATANADTGGWEYDSGGVGGEDGPRTPYLRPGRVTATSIEVLWDDDEAATGWVVRRSPGHSRHRPTGVPRWFADGLAPETSYEFGAIAVDGDHGLESDEATIVITTGGEVPSLVSAGSDARWLTTGGHSWGGNDS